jgi:hypothetical protein
VRVGDPEEFLHLSCSWYSIYSTSKFGWVVEQKYLHLSQVFCTEDGLDPFWLDTFLFGVIACIFVLRTDTPMEFSAVPRVFLLRFVAVLYPRLNKSKCELMLFSVAVIIRSWDHLLFLEIFPFGQGGHRLEQTSNRALPSHLLKKGTTNGVVAPTVYICTLFSTSAISVSLLS